MLRSHVCMYGNYDCNGNVMSQGVLALYLMLTTVLQHHTALASKCADRFSCDACLLAPGCGWCTSVDACLEGSLTRATYAPDACSFATATWYSFTCPQFGCDSALLCEDCLRRSRCGWCGRTGTCEYGAVNQSVTYASACQLDSAAESTDWIFPLGNRSNETILDTSRQRCPGDVLPERQSLLWLLLLLIILCALVVGAVSLFLRWHAKRRQNVVKPMRNDSSNDMRRTSFSQLPALSSPNCDEPELADREG